jgi:hypothetical protein
METIAGYTFWDYNKLPDKKLKELVKDSPNEKIQSICSYKRLSPKQVMCLAIYLDSKGKYDDYSYLIKLKEERLENYIIHPPLCSDKES